jgi:hypothetical protein
MEDVGKSGAAGFTGCESKAGELGVDREIGGDIRGDFGSGISSSNLLSYFVGALFCGSSNGLTDLCIGTGLYGESGLWFD